MDRPTPDARARRRRGPASPEPPDGSSSPADQGPALDPSPAAGAASIDAPAAAQRPTGPAAGPGGTVHLRRIQEAAAATGLTTRSIRYYEEMGLLRPAARSAGAYRLYDDSDVERLLFIRDLRDDAGFSLAEIGRLLEDEDARIRDAERFRRAADTAEKRAIVRDLIARVDRQVATLEAKAARLRLMIDTATARSRHLRAHLAELEGGDPAHAHGDPAPAQGRGPAGAPAGAPESIDPGARRRSPAGRR